MSVKQSIKVTNAGLSPILSVAQGTGAIEYEFTVSDFDIPSGSAAVAYNIQPTGNIVSQTCSISGNTITIKPPAYYFLRGKNYMQFQVSRNNEDLFSFLIEVWCAPNISQPEVIVAENPSLVSQLISDVGLLSSRLNNLLSIPSGSLSTSADAALDDIKVGYDGTTYNTPGDAVRKQTSELLNKIVYVAKSVKETSQIFAESITWEMGGLKPNTGKEIATNKVIRSNVCYISASSDITFDGDIDPDMVKYAYFYGEDGEFLGRDSSVPFVMPENTKSLRFTYGYTEASQNTITSAGGVDEVAKRWHIKYESPLQKEMTSIATETEKMRSESRNYETLAFSEGEFLWTPKFKLGYAFNPSDGQTITGYSTNAADTIFYNYIDGMQLQYTGKKTSEDETPYVGYVWPYDENYNYVNNGRKAFVLSGNVYNNISFDADTVKYIRFSFSFSQSSGKEMTEADIANFGMTSSTPLQSLFQIRSVVAADYNGLLANIVVPANVGPLRSSEWNDTPCMKNGYLKVESIGTGVYVLQKYICHITDSTYWRIVTVSTKIPYNDWQAESEYLSNILLGKTIIGLGDSLLYGQGVGGDNSKTWFGKLTTNYGMTGYNYGISGNTIGTIPAEYAEQDDTMPMWQRISDIFEQVPSCDYFVLLGGANDCWRNVPIGTMTDTTGATFMGAINYIITYIRENYRNAKGKRAKLLLMTNYNRKLRTSATGHTDEEYVDAMLEVAHYRGIPCIDNYHDVGLDLRRENDVGYATDAKWACDWNEGTTTNHLSEEGYNYLLPIYEKKLKSI